MTVDNERTGTRASESSGYMGNTFHGLWVARRNLWGRRGILRVHCPEDNGTHGQFKPMEPSAEAPCVRKLVISAVTYHSLEHSSIRKHLARVYTPAVLSLLNLMTLSCSTTAENPVEKLFKPVGHLANVIQISCISGDVFSIAPDTKIRCADTVHSAVYRDLRRVRGACRPVDFSWFDSALFVYVTDVSNGGCFAGSIDWTIVSDTLLVRANIADSGCKAAYGRTRYFLAFRPRHEMKDQIRFAKIMDDAMPELSRLVKFAK